jgi:hypothetical protein
MKWTAADVVQALREAYGITVDAVMQAEEWSLVTEMPLRADVRRRGLGSLNGAQANRFNANLRTIDVLLTRNWSSGKGHERIAVEVKVSRSDFRNETDAKRQPAEHSAHRTTYAAPAGLLKPEEMPEGWGLIEVYETVEAARAGTGWLIGDERYSRAKWRKRATDREPMMDADHMLAQALRRASRLEERIRRGEDAAAEVAALRAAVERAEGVAARASEAKRREQGRMRYWRDLFMATEGAQVCGTCDQPITFVLRRMEWRHADSGHDGRCYELRAERERLRRERATGARYIASWADPVTPKAVQQHADDPAEEGITA